MDIKAGQIWKCCITGGTVKVDEVTLCTVRYDWLSGEGYTTFCFIEEFLEQFTRSDAINHPEHYTSHPSGIECIEVTRHMSFAAGNIIKYLWRNGLKDGEPSLKDLKKAAWYLNDMIDQLEANGE